MESVIVPLDRALLSSCRKKKKKFYFAKQIDVTTNTQIARSLIMAGCQKKAFAHQSWPPITLHNRTQKCANVHTLRDLSQRWTQNTDYNKTMSNYL